MTLHPLLLSSEIISVLTDVTSGDYSTSPHATTSDGNVTLARTASHDAMISTSNSRKDLASLAVQTVFRILDYVRAWKNFRIEELATSQGGKGKERLHTSDTAYQAIDKFYEKIPKVGYGGEIRIKIRFDFSRKKYEEITT